MEKTDDEKLKNLRDSQAIEKLKELAEKAQVCMFTTAAAQAPFNTRPMSPVEIDDSGHIWFFSDLRSDKNREIAQCSVVHLNFSNISNSEFLSVNGTAEIIMDKQKFEELWKPIVKVWFQKGTEDPNLSLIKVTPGASYYWDTQHGKMIALAKLITSVATGKPMDDSIEGKLVI